MIKELDLEMLFQLFFVFSLTGRRFAVESIFQGQRAEADDLAGCRQNISGNRVFPNRARTTTDAGDSHTFYYFSSLDVK